MRHAGNGRHDFAGLGALVEDMSIASANLRQTCLIELLGLGLILGRRPQGLGVDRWLRLDRRRSELVTMLQRLPRPSRTSSSSSPA